MRSTHTERAESAKNRGGELYYEGENEEINYGVKQNEKQKHRRSQLREVNAAKEAGDRSLEPILPSAVNTQCLVYFSWRKKKQLLHTTCDVFVRLL